jgi:hypothetical protein
VTAHTMITTALLLGAFVLLAGLYGLFYTLAMLFRASYLKPAGFACYALHFGVMILIVVATPLGPWWKALIVASCLAYFAIPPVTWRYLVRLHLKEGAIHDTKRTQRVARAVAGIRGGS